MAPETGDLAEVRRRLLYLAAELDDLGWHAADPGIRMRIFQEAGHLRLARELAFQGAIGVPAAALWITVGADRVLHWRTLTERSIDDA